MILEDKSLTSPESPESLDKPELQFTAQQLQVITLIANGATITEAASSASLHRNTVGNWRKHVPGFAAELEFATAEQAIYWHEEAVALAPKAISILSTILHNDQSSDSLKFRAASLILKMAANPKIMHKAAQPPPEPKQPPAPKFDLSQYFPPLTDPETDTAQQPIRKSSEPGRNSLCSCGSNLKYKRCCANLPTTPTPQPANASPYCPPSTQAPI